MEATAKRCAVMPFAMDLGFFSGLAGSQAEPRGIHTSTQSGRRNIAKPGTNVDLGVEQSFDQNACVEYEPLQRLRSLES
jgi:hypothetical protein